MTDDKLSAASAGSPPTSPLRVASPAALQSSTPTFVDKIDPYNNCTRQRKVYGSSRYHNIDEGDLTKLPLIKETPVNERWDLVRQKLQQCRKVFDFEDPMHNVRSKQIKREALQELVSYFATPLSNIPEDIYTEVIKVFETNTVRDFNAPSNSEFDPDEDEPDLEASWPHLQHVYELLLRFLENVGFQPSTAKKHINVAFIFKILHLLNSGDPRERDCLKTILHRVYGKFLGFRGLLRKHIGYVFLMFIYDSSELNGISELLEVLGSIINGFALPLKLEHRSFFLKMLLPLHTHRSLALYHNQLVYCVLQYLEKDPSLVVDTVNALLKYWPHVNSQKEVLFLTEIEEILEIIDPEVFKIIMIPLFTKLSKCFKSDHFQVAERSLCIFSNERILSLINESNRTIIPLVVPDLHSVHTSHWNKVIRGSVTHAMDQLTRMNGNLVNEELDHYAFNQRSANQRNEKREEMWKYFDALSSKLANMMIDETVDTASDRHVQDVNEEGTADRVLPEDDNKVPNASEKTGDLTANEAACVETSSMEIEKSPSDATN